MKNKYIIFFLIITIVFGGVYFLGLKQGSKKTEPTVSSQIILDKIKEQYFLVTKTLFLNTDIDLVIKDEEGWKKIFTANSIKAQGLVRVDVGVDLRSIKNSNIEIDEKKKELVLFIPQAEILDSSLSGEIKIETKKGIWTSIEDFFAGDESKEYNLASSELIGQAESAARKKTDVFQEAYSDSEKFIKLIVTSVAPDYTLKIEELN